MPDLYKRTSEKTEEELNRDFEIYIQSKTVNGRYCPTPDFCGYSESEDMFLYSFEESCTYCTEQNSYDSCDEFSDCDAEIEEYYTNYSFIVAPLPIPSPTSVMSFLEQ